MENYQFGLKILQRSISRIEILEKKVFQKTENFEK